MSTRGEAPGGVWGRLCWVVVVRSPWRGLGVAVWLRNGGVDFRTSWKVTGFILVGHWVHPGRSSGLRVMPIAATLIKD
jgi:hypothetical protein